MLRLGHLNITVADRDRSTDFYGRWFGFDRVLADYPDGTRFITDASGFELGLHAGQPIARPAEWHFGFLAPDAETARALRAALAADGVEIIQPEDEDAYVGFKCLDPDGHMIEVYWEPRH